MSKLRSTEAKKTIAFRDMKRTEPKSTAIIQLNIFRSTANETFILGKIYVRQCELKSEQKSHKTGIIKLSSSNILQYFNACLWWKVFAMADLRAWMACDEKRSLLKWWTDLENCNLRIENEAFIVESFSIKKLCGTGLKVALSKSFGTYTEKRDFKVNLTCRHKNVSRLRTCLGYLWIAAKLKLFFEQTSYWA